MMQAGAGRMNTRVGLWLGACLVASAGACAIGCSDASPYDLVKASGTVKYEDGSLIPAETIMLKFEPQAAALDSRTHPRKAYGTVNVADGTFDTLTTHKYGDGIVSGRHKVLVIPMTKDQKVTNLVPNEYRNAEATPIEVDTDQQPMEIRIKKPKGPS